MNKELYNCLKPKGKKEYNPEYFQKTSQLSIDSNTIRESLVIDGKTHSITGKRSHLSMVSLRDFIYHYSQELEEYYEEYFGGGESEWSPENIDGKESRYMVFCMVDFSNEEILTKDVSNRIRKSGLNRRRKIKHRYSYVNPMNRIHGFIILKRDNVKINCLKKVMTISVIATSGFSQKKGVGTDLLDITIQFAKDCEYDDIILEIANDKAGELFYEESSDNEDVLSSYEEKEDTEEESNGNFWYPDEDVLDIISHELWRKIMRKPDGDIPYYNIDKNYIKEEIENYFLHINYLEEGGRQKEIIEYHNPSPNISIRVCGGRHSYEKKEKKINISDNPKDTDYGGYWYKLGKESQKRLMEFYGKFGFVEDPSVHIEWGIFEKISPFPTMRLNFNVKKLINQY